MKKPLVDNWWSKISEREAVGLAAANDKLQALGEVEEAIRASEGSDAVRNVLADGLIRRALERCIEIHEGDSALDCSDLSIYYNYASVEAKKSEQIIDDELAHLGL